MKKENLRTAEYNRIKHPKKLVWLKDRMGEASLVETERFTVINTSKNYYRKMKKQLQRG